MTPSFPRREASGHTGATHLAAHSLVGAASIGKATARGLITKHPSAIRHIHLPTLILAGKTALQVVADTQAAHRTSAPDWDDLVIGAAQPWQLDLGARIDAAVSQGWSFATQW